VLRIAQRRALNAMMQSPTTLSHGLVDGAARVQDDRGPGFQEPVDELGQSLDVEMLGYGCEADLDRGHARRHPVGDQKAGHHLRAPAPTRSDWQYQWQIG
jgi:hypothetical protein